MVRLARNQGELGMKHVAHRLLIALCLALPLACSDGSGSHVRGDGHLSKPGVYSGYSEPIYDGFKITSEYVPVRDGTRLAIDLYRPLDEQGQLVEEPLPVLWMHTPYARRLPGNPGGITMGEVYAGNAAQLVKYGYVVALVDFRGLYASFGENAGYNRGEWVEAARWDAYDVTEWLAKQPWSDGKIGMWGCSATGGSQLQAATTAPPSLLAVFPMSCEFDAYASGVPGGMAPEAGDTIVLSDSRTPEVRNQRAAPVDNDVDATLLAEAIASHGEPLDNLGYMPFRDSIAERLPVEWWRVSSPASYLDDLNASNTAFYFAANWDDIYKHGVFFALSNLTRPGKLLIGPGSHCAWSGALGQGAAPGTVLGDTGFDITVEERRFFDYWLKGIDNHIMDEPAVYYYTYGAPEGQEWNAAASWPLPNEDRVRYYLGDGLLGTDVPIVPTVTDSVVVNYETGEDNAAGHGLVYETAPLDHPVQVTGHPVMELWLASTADDSDVVAYLQNVAPDGSIESYTVHGHLRASLRREAPAPYDNLGLPWHPFRAADAEPLVPGEPALLRFDLLPLSMIFDAGHRIRLLLTFADVQTPQQVPAPTVSVFRDSAHPSSIVLPLIPQ